MRVVVILSLLGLGTLAYASDAQVADLLFGKVKDQLSRSEQAEIVRQLGWTVGKDGKTLLDPVCGLPASSETTVEDLNRDGIPEIFVVGGNTCLSGGGWLVGVVVYQGRVWPLSGASGVSRGGV